MTLITCIYNSVSKRHLHWSKDQPSSLYKYIYNNSLSIPLKLTYLCWYHKAPSTTLKHKFPHCPCQLWLCIFYIFLTSWQDKCQIKVWTQKSVGNRPIGVSISKCKWTWSVNIYNEDHYCLGSILFDLTSGYYKIWHFREHFLIQSVYYSWHLSKIAKLQNYEKGIVATFNGTTLLNDLISVIKKVYHTYI